MKKQIRTAQKLTLIAFVITAIISYCASFIELPITSTDTFRVFVLTLACFTFIKFMLQNRSKIEL
jgi:hypothetical protein